jgi:hypothetical protein
MENLGKNYDTSCMYQTRNLKLHAYACMVFLDSYSN